MNTSSVFRLSFLISSIISFALGFAAATIAQSESVKKNEISSNLIKDTLTDFENDFNTSVDVEITFESPDWFPTIADPNTGTRPAHGLCDYQLQTIHLNVKHWQKLNKWQKKELLYHELGHCVLNLSHVELNESIMNPFSPTTYWVQSNGSNWINLVNNMKLRFHLKQTIQRYLTQ